MPHLLVPSLATVAFAVTVAPASLAVPITYDVTEDTFVRSVSAERGNNFGSSDNIQIKNDAGTGANNSRLGVISFDTAVLNGNVNDASLDLFLVSESDSAGTSYGIYGINDGTADEDFDESTLTFNSAGFADASDNSALDLTNLTDLGSILTSASDEGGFVTLGGAGLLAFLNADTNGIASFVIQRNQSNFDVDNFRSKEATPGDATDASRLNVDLIEGPVVPEPASLALLGLGTLCLLGRRRA